MKKTSILAIGLILVLILLTVSLLALTSHDSSSSDYSHVFSYTKAMCNSENFCQDYEIRWENETTLKISPITGAAVQFSPIWKDKRDENIRNKIC